MKKLVFSALVLASTSFSSNAQLADGSIAPDFTVTAYQSWLSTSGMNNNGTYNLYDYLDAGYTVILDVSATWCGPCWNHHLTGALDDLYINHGPAGQLGVSGTTTDDVMVIWLDGDGATADATMLDGSGTIGNWIQPNATIGQVPFPMANPITATANQINNGYNIAYFPTIYKICPNRVVSEVGQLNAAQFYTSVGTCPPPASAPADAAAVTFDSDLVVCGGNYTPVVTIQNNGTTALTSATVTVLSGATTVSTGTYTGNLATYGITQVTCTPIAAYAGGTLNVVVTTSSDANAGNGTLSAVISNAVQATGITGTVAIVSDQYGSETTWTVKNSGGATVASGGPYADLGAAGTTVQPIVNFNMVANGCYTFEILDSFGDGINSAQYGLGTYTVKDGTGATIASGGVFADSDSKAFKAGTAGIEEIAINGFNVFPNPASSVVNVSFEASNADYTVSLLDLQGRVISSNTYYNLADVQSIEMSVEGIASGNYLVKVVTEGAMSVEKVVIK